MYFPRANDCWSDSLTEKSFSYDKHAVNGRQHLSNNVDVILQETYENNRGTVENGVTETDARKKHSV